MVWWTAFHIVLWTGQPNQHKVTDRKANTQSQTHIHSLFTICVSHIRFWWSVWLSTWMDLSRTHIKMCFCLKVRWIKSEIHTFLNTREVLTIPHNACALPALPTSSFQLYSIQNHIHTPIESSSTAKNSIAEKRLLIDSLFSIYFSCLSSVTPA